MIKNITVTFRDGCKNYIQCEGELTMKRKMISTMLAITMAFSLIACGSSDKNAKTADSSSTTEDTSASDDSDTAVSDLKSRNCHEIFGRVSEFSSQGRHRSRY